MKPGSAPRRGVPVGIFEVAMLLFAALLPATGAVRARALRAAAEEGVANSRAWSRDDLDGARFLARHWIPLLALGILLAGAGLWLRLADRSGGDVLQIAGVFLAGGVAHARVVERELARLRAAAAPGAAAEMSAQERP